MEHHPHPELGRLAWLYFKVAKTEAETRYLQEEMEKDPELEGDILAYLALDHALGHELVHKNRRRIQRLRDELKDGMDSAESEQYGDGKRSASEEARKKVLAFRRRVILASAAAASVALVCLIALWPRPSGAERLYAQYYSPDHSYIVHQGPGPGDHRFGQAVELFKQGDPEVALPLMRAFWEGDTAADSSNYFMGQLHLAMDAPSDAIPYFEQVATGSDSSRYHSAAMWYLALAQLRVGKLQQATHTLDGLMQVKDRYGRNAPGLAAAIKALEADS